MRKLHIFYAAQQEGHKSTRFQDLGIKPVATSLYA
jgi:hypothetical protein